MAEVANTGERMANTSPVTRSAAVTKDGKSEKTIIAITGL